MAAFDHGVKIIAQTTGRELARLAGIQCQQWQPGESTLQATLERLADRVFLARNGAERFVVYFEFHTTWNEDVLWSLLAKSGLLSEREKLPTRTVVVVLRRQGFRSLQGRWRLTAEGSPTQALWFREVCLWRIRPEAWWDKVPGLMALYPLCRHRQSPKKAVGHAVSAIEKSVPGPSERADLLTILGVFGKLAYPLLDIEGIIGREKMKESKFYQDILTEGKHQGALETKQQDTLKLLESRFGVSARKQVAAKVNAITDINALERLFEVAIHCPQLADFRSALSVQEE